MNLRLQLRMAIVAVLLSSTLTLYAQSRMENLGRGVVAVRTSSTQVYVGWRMLGTDPANISFNLYRSAKGGAAVKLNSSPLTATTNFVDSTANAGQANAYFVRPLVNGVETTASASFTLPANSPTRQFLSVLIQPPPGGPPTTLVTLIAQTTAASAILTVTVSTRSSLSGTHPTQKTTLKVDTRQRLSRCLQTQRHETVAD